MILSKQVWPWNPSSKNNRWHIPSDCALCTTIINLANIKLPKSSKRGTVISSLLARHMILLLVFPESVTAFKWTHAPNETTEASEDPCKEILSSRPVRAGPMGLRAYGPTGLRAYGPTGLRAYGPTGLRAYGPTGLRAYGPTGLRAYGPTGLRAYGPTGLRPTGLRAYGPTGLRAYGPTGLRAYGPTGLRAYGPTGLRAYGPTGLRAYGPTGLRAYGPMGLRAYGYPLLEVLLLHLKRWHLQ